MTEKKIKIKEDATIRFKSFLGDYQGCGTIRVIYPSLLLNQFRYENKQFQASYDIFFTRDPDYYRNFSFVQFQRLTTKNQINMIHYFHKEVRRQSNTPIIYEIDDYIMDIPEWNFASQFYKENEKNVKTIMSFVDGMIVSTPTLKKYYSNYCKNISVIPNHLPKFIWGDIYPKHDYEPRTRKEKPIILWAGSGNHFSMEDNIKGGDMNQRILDYIRRTVHDYRWVFVGGFPLELDDLKGNLIEYHGWIDTFNYPRKLKEIDADICIAPLDDNKLNRGKSNIKALEYTALGCPAVYQHIDPYRTMKLKAKTGSEFVDYIEKLIDDIDYRKRVWEHDYKILKDQLWWEDNKNLVRYINTYLAFFGKYV